MKNYWKNYKINVKCLGTRKPVTDSVDSNTATDNQNTKTVWRLEPCEGSNTNVNCAFEMIPAFVNRSVKVHLIFFRI